MQAKKIRRDELNKTKNTRTQNTENRKQRERFKILTMEMKH